MKSILDPTFRYTPSTHTDLSKTFARVRREQRKQLRIVPKPDAVAGTNVSPITHRTSRGAR